MGTANRDASQITVRNRNKAENSYYEAWKSATVTASGPVNMAVTRPTGAGAAVVAEIKLGCSACYVDNTTTDPNQTRYPPNYSSGGAGRSI
jgi:hypothetical protein